MMHFQNEHAHARRRVTLGLASMIDVVFLLLIFFMVATVVRPQESTLATQLDGRTAPASSLEPQVVRITMSNGQPVWRIGAHQLSDPRQLEAVLGTLSMTAGLSVSPEGDVPVGAGVAVVEAAQAAGMKSVRWDDLDGP